MHRAAQTTLVLTVTAFVVFGISMLYSTSYAAHGEHFLVRQLIWVALGSAGAVALWRLDYRRLGKIAWVGLAAVGLSLLYLATAYVLYKLPFVPRTISTNLPLIGAPIKGSFRWLRLAGFSLQPSEFAKPVLILFLADYLGRKSRHLQQFNRGFLRPLGGAGATLALIFLGKDLSTTVITGTVVMAIAFVAGVRLRYLAVVALFGLLFLVMVLNMSPERMRRFTVYRNPEAHQSAEGYQLWHSQLALGSGGVTGLGFTESRMKQMYLPEAHTDFIVAIVGEELGFVAVVALMLGYCVLTGSAFWIGALATDRQGVLVCIGVGLLIGIQAFINISVVSGYCPTTGVTAPFLSYGGSSMLSSMLGIGLVLSVSRISAREALNDSMRSHYGVSHEE